MGKNYSKGNSEKRHPADFYQTPYNCTRALFDRENFVGDYLEPACGKEAIVDVMRERNINATFFDLQDSKDGYDTDFLYYGKQHDNIITNPPFTLALDFILKAKRVARRKFSFFLPLNYLHGKQRYNIVYKDTEFPLSKVYIITRYLTLTEEKLEKAIEGGMVAYAWFVWNKEYKRRPEFDWIEL